MQVQLAGCGVELSLRRQSNNGRWSLVDGSWGQLIRVGGDGYIDDQ